jgi:hypothetical protein
MRSKMMYALLMVTQLAWASWATAATYPQPPAVSAFNITGFIQAASLDPQKSPTDVLAGGTVTVNGTTVVVPRNTIVVMSAANLTWYELWKLAPLPWGLTAAGGNGQSGLALSDRDLNGNPPLTTYEVTIQGNRIKDSAGNDLYVAALVFMAQQSLNLGQGFINYIDYATGTLHVGCQPLGAACAACVGARVQINDPAQVPTTANGLTGRYSIGLSPDPRFTADTDNPTIRAKTGYPMCIPRAVPPAPLRPDDLLPAGYTESDPLCPQINRPLDPDTGGPLGNFTLGRIRNFPPGVIGVVNVLATAIQNGDPWSQAPFQVGDYIEILGHAAAGRRNDHRGGDDSRKDHRRAGVPARDALDVRPVRVGLADRGQRRDLHVAQCRARLGRAPTEPSVSRTGADHPRHGRNTHQCADSGPDGSHDADQGTRLLHGPDANG